KLVPISGGSRLNALIKIHYEDAIHQDLHSGNILNLQIDQRFDISDFGFCGPADKPTNSIYGNLPYIAPEVIAGKKTTFKSDIYSIAILMWEISSGQPPFINYEHDYYLAMNIINGIRPRIISGTPLEYESLMKQCWDADPLKRPDIYTLLDKISKMNRLYQNMPIASAANDDLEMNKTSSSGTSYTSRLLTSKVHQFGNFPEPRNATEDPQNDYIDDDKEIHNNPNLHSEEQNELEIPEGKEFFKR
ncbi:kinase-like domain-containing protein, partial [Glomus cerebriforme]